jgi:hypothetical protein
MKIAEINPIKIKIPYHATSILPILKAVGLACVNANELTKKIVNGIKITAIPVIINHCHIPMLSSKIENDRLLLSACCKDI